MFIQTLHERFLVYLVKIVGGLIAAGDGSKGCTGKSVDVQTHICKAVWDEHRFVFKCPFPYLFALCRQAYYLL